MYLRIFGRLNPPKIRSANSKERFCSQIANPQIATFLEGLQILQVLYVRKWANLQFAELVREPGTFGNHTWRSLDSFRDSA